MVSSFKSPGVLVREQVRGAIPANIASHSDIYMFGTVTSLNPVFNIPQPVSGVQEFIELYGSGNPSRVFAEAIFANHPSASLNFIPVKIFKRSLITISEPAIDEVYTLNFVAGLVNLTLTYTALVNDTESTIVNYFVNEISNASQLVDVVKVQPSNTEDTFYIVELVDTEVTGNLSTVVTEFSSGLTPIVNDFIDSMQETLTEDNNYSSGFIIHPQAFTLFQDTIDRTALITATEAVAESTNCVAIVDCKAGLNTANGLLNDRKLYGSPKGHSSYFAPWLIFNDGIENREIPPSPVVAATWAKYIRNFGLNKSPLGSQSPLVVSGLKYNFSKADSDFVNLDGVNLIRSIAKLGFVIWGGRTMSIDPRYAFCSSRVIMNSINETCETAFIPYVGLTISIQGGTFHDLRNTGDGILFRYWNNGDLYGNTPEEAYLVVCDNSNNPPADLDQGLVKIDLYAVTAPTLERILVTTIKIPIGQLGNL